MNNYQIARLTLIHGLFAGWLFTSLPVSAAVTVTGFFRPDSAADWQSGSFDRRFTVIGGSSQDGTLTMDGGSTLTVTGQGTYFGSGTSPANAIVNLTDANTRLTINSTDEFVLGNTTGTGTMSILNGASFVNTQNAFIGRGTAGPGGELQAEGHLTIDGADSLWQAITIDVGRTATGSLTVQNEGRVEATNLFFGRSDSTGFPNGIGSLTVDGTDSTISLTGQTGLNQGSTGHLSNGGRIDADGAISVGGSLVLEDSGSRISSGGNFGVSSTDGQASITLQDGAQVQVGNSGDRADTTVGFMGGLGGELTVQGSGSVWSNSGNFFVGDRGDGVLNILDGGRVNNGVIFRLQSQGEVNVRDAGSLLQNNREMVLEDGGVLNVATGGQVTTRQFLEVQPGATVNLFVDRSGMVRTGTGGFNGGYDNRGTTNLFAAAGLASGDYTPIEVLDSNAGIGNVGTINAIGGTFNTGTGIFSVSDITTDPDGPLGGLRVQYAEDMVVSFADGIGEIEFSISALNVDFIEGEFILAGYLFDTTLDDVPTGLTFILQEEYEFEDLTFWYLADGETEWSVVDPDATQLVGTDASVQVDRFSSYAVTHATVVPEPTGAALLAAGGLLVLARRRRSRSF